MFVFFGEIIVGVLGAGPDVQSAISLASNERGLNCLFLLRQKAGGSMDQVRLGWVHLPDQLL